LSYSPLAILAGMLGLVVIKLSARPLKLALSQYASLHAGISMVICIGAVAFISHLPQLPLADRPPIDCAVTDKSKVELTLQSTEVTKQQLTLPLALDYLKTNNFCRDKEDRLFVYRGSPSNWISAIQIEEMGESKSDHICGVAMDSLEINANRTSTPGNHLIG